MDVLPFFPFVVIFQNGDKCFSIIHLREHIFPTPCFARSNGVTVIFVHFLLDRYIGRHYHSERPIFRSGLSLGGLHAYRNPNTRADKCMGFPPFSRGLIRPAQPGRDPFRNRRAWTATIIGAPTPRLAGAPGSSPSTRRRPRGGIGGPPSARGGANLKGASRCRSAVLRGGS
jgi:hypothetical protein